MRPYGTPQTLEKRRVQAIRFLKAGHTYRSVAVKLGASLSSVVRWHQSYQDEGSRGLRPKDTPGRPSLLDEKQKQRLLAILVEGALDAGYTTDLWTLKRIGEVVRREFGVRYSISNVWKLMNALGWSCQKPEKRARERNEKAIRYWQQHVWPRIKKNRKTWSPFGVP
jgi:transposase